MKLQYQFQFGRRCGEVVISGDFSHRGGFFGQGIYMGVNPKIGVENPPKWMVYLCLFHGKPYFLMDDLGYPYFWKHPCIPL